MSSPVWEPLAFPAITYKDWAWLGFSTRDMAFILPAVREILQEMHWTVWIPHSNSHSEFLPVCVWVHVSSQMKQPESLLSLAIYFILFEKLNAWWKEDSLLVLVKRELNILHWKQYNYNLNILYSVVTTCWAAELYTI